MWLPPPWTWFRQPCISVSQEGVSVSCPESLELSDPCFHSTVLPNLRPQAARHARSISSCLPWWLLLSHSPQMSDPVRSGCAADRDSSGGESAWSESLIRLHPCGSPRLVAKLLTGLDESIPANHIGRIQGTLFPVFL